MNCCLSNCKQNILLLRDLILMYLLFVLVGLLVGWLDLDRRRRILSLLVWCVVVDAFPE